ncbi:hypothetical protein GCM10022261_27990 [Brevibacterium daeguense]|uniref:Cell division protein FtsL n=1 Tax=Brevibacterium daeguense TaxID=909936 RepID=A0ABP8ENG2_9MICO|nr:cell division protein FtsL [Brevibacterium daeguense]
MSPVAQAVETAPVRKHSTAPLRGSEAARLRLVVPEIARRRLPFSAVCILALVIGILGVLLLNIFISHSTYRVEQLTIEQDRLHSERDQLTEDISYRESPQNIAAAAEELGLERDLTPEYIRLSDGKIISPGEVPGNTHRNPETVPGPRADARQDVRPNLRSDEKLPAVGGGSEEIPAPSQRSPE